MNYIYLRVKYIYLIMTLINSLPSLEDIYDSIKTDDFLVNKEKNDLCDFILKIIDQFIINNPLLVTEENYDELLENYIEEELSIMLENIQMNEVFEEEIEMVVEQTINIYFEFFTPPRSYPSSIILKEPDYNVISKQIDFLRSVPQPEQRTDEWYMFRHNLITASNAYKAFESASTQNQLIYEKCKPLIIEEKQNSKPISIDSTLHWGQKYEPLSVELYEDLYNTKIEDFGCIPHQKYKFLGASPDGINVKEKNSRFGRMLEIKNIVNREITGIPKKEYWVQMQLQMEVCNLDECDFLETKFEEYENEEQYLSDKNSIKKGIILYFNGSNGVYKYIYKPLNMMYSESWQEDQIEQQEKLGNIWIKNIYWKLTKYSCVLVTRNHFWFENAIIQLNKTWDIISKERLSGFEHRKSKPRNKKIEINQLINNIESGCLLSLDKDSKLVTLKQ